MYEMTMPGDDGESIKSFLVQKIQRLPDAGTEWARALSPSQVADLVDLAGELARIFPVTQNKSITPAAFHKKLDKIGALQEGNKKLARVIGVADGRVELFSVWWAGAYVFYLAKESAKSDNDDEVAAAIAMEMKLKPKILNARLMRRDISYLTSLFLTRVAREMLGEVSLRVAQGARSGDARMTDLYFKHVVGEDRDDTHGGEIHFDPHSMTENERMAEIKKLRKQVGEEAEEIEVNLPALDVDFDATE